MLHLSSICLTIYTILQNCKQKNMRGIINILVYSRKIWLVSHKYQFQWLINVQTCAEVLKVTYIFMQDFQVGLCAVGRLTYIGWLYSQLSLCAELQMLGSEGHKICKLASSQWSAFQVGFEFSCTVTQMHKDVRKYVLSVSSCNPETDMM